MPGPFGTVANAVAIGIVVQARTLQEEEQPPQAAFSR
jgi:hypothetical protein